MDDSERMSLTDHRRGGSRRKVVRFIPDFSAGTVGLIVSVLGGFIGLYVGLSSDNAKRDERIATVQRDREQDRLQVNATLQEIKTEQRETTRAINDTKENVAAIKAQLTVLQSTTTNRGSR